MKKPIKDILKSSVWLICVELHLHFYEAVEKLIS